MSDGSGFDCSNIDTELESASHSAQQHVILFSFMLNSTHVLETGLSNCLAGLLLSLHLAQTLPMQACNLSCFQRRIHHKVAQHDRSSDRSCWNWPTLTLS